MKLLPCVALWLIGLVLIACDDEDGTEPGGSAGDSSEAGSDSNGGSSGAAGSGSSGKGGSEQAGTGQSGEAGADGVGGAPAMPSSCEPNPCLNGTCSEVASGSSEFSCSCDAGFTGSLCDQVATNACTVNP